MHIDKRVRSIRPPAIAGVQPGNVYCLAYTDSTYIGIPCDGGVLLYDITNNKLWDPSEELPPRLIDITDRVELAIRK